MILTVAGIIVTDMMKKKQRKQEMRKR